MVNILTIHEAWGGIFALTSALMWAFAAILFMRLGNKVSPLGMNLGKGIVAIICLGILLLLTDTGSVSKRTFLFLGISGLLFIIFGFLSEIVTRSYFKDEKIYTIKQILN